MSNPKIKYPNPTPGKVVEIGFSHENRVALATIAQAKQAIKDAEQAIADAELVLRNALGDAEIGTVSGVKAVKVAVVNREEPDRTKMKADGIWADYSYANGYNYLSI